MAEEGDQVQFYVEKELISKLISEDSIVLEVDPGDQLGIKVQEITLSVDPDGNEGLLVEGTVTFVRTIPIEPIEVE